MASLSTHGEAPPRIAIVWRGDPTAAQGHNERLAPVAQALVDLGAEVPPIVWSEAAAREVQLLACDGALVWVDPLTNGQDRNQLDRLLSEVSKYWVSARPECRGNNPPLVGS